MDRSYLRELAQFAVRELPLVRGKHRLATFVTPRLGEFPQPAYAKLANGSKMLVTPETHSEFWYLGNYEPDVTGVFMTRLGLIEPGRCFVDIGANAGYYTMLAANQIDGHTYAFEPNNESLAQLEANIELNGFNNVTTVNAAVSTETGVAELHVHESITSLSSLQMVHADLDSNFQVATVSLDDYFDDRPGERVGLIKIDIQGAELWALRGAERLLARDRPPLIIEEWPFGAEGFGYNYREVKALLAGLGYRFYTIGQGRLRWSLVRPADPVEADVGVGRAIDTNLLCLAD